MWYKYPPKELKQVKYTRYRVFFGTFSYPKFDTVKF